jgi:hypothetical protein
MKRSEGCATEGGILGRRTHVRLVMLQKIQNHQHAARLEPLGQPAGRQRRVVKVVEPEAYGGNVKVGELGRGERGRVGVFRHAEVALVGVHLGGGEALFWCECQYWAFFRFFFWERVGVGWEGVGRHTWFSARPL